MKYELDQFFDELKRNLEGLGQAQDNEAIRHDLLVRPILTHPLVLGWHAPEVIPQHNIDVAPTIRYSYVWQKAEPKKRRPDIVVIPYGLSNVVAVIEEKARQKSIRTLYEHLSQVKEYQYLHSAVWGLLTDGEKWLLQKNNETYLVFESLDELKKGLPELQHCIGRKALIHRIREYGTTDLVIVRPSPAIVILASPLTAASVHTLVSFLEKPSFETRDLVVNLFESVRSRMFNYAKESNEASALSDLFEDLIHNDFTDLTSAVIGFSTIATDYSKGKKVIEDYRKATQEWIKWFTELNLYAECLLCGEAFSAAKFIHIIRKIGNSELIPIKRVINKAKRLQKSGEQRLKPNNGIQ